MNTLQENQEIANPLDVFIGTNKPELRNKFVRIPKALFKRENFEKLPRGIWSVLPLLFLSRKETFVKYLSLEDMSALSGLTRKTIARILNEFFDGASDSVRNKSKKTKAEKDLIDNDTFRKNFIRTFGFSRIENELKKGRMAYDYLIEYEVHEVSDKVLVRRSFIEEKWDKMNQSEHMIYFEHLDNSKYDPHCLDGVFKKNRERHINDRKFNMIQDIRPYQFFKGILSKNTISKSIMNMKTNNILIEHPILEQFTKEEVLKSSLYGCKNPKLLYLGQP